MISEFYAMEKLKLIFRILVCLLFLKRNMLLLYIRTNTRYTYYHKVHLSNNMVGKSALKTQGLE